jgi:polysaccharide export outer membrane protein
MMKFSRIAFYLMLSLATATASAQERYQLNSGDVLDISVWNEPELQKQVIVLPDGVISFPLAGEIVAKDRNVADVQAELTKNLTEFLADPVVTVTVTSVAGNSIHILGKANNPGPIVMSQPIDVLQALSMAGGTSPYAEENNIIVVRRNGDIQKVIPIRYADLKKGESMESNIILRSGDVMIVP